MVQLHQGDFYVVPLNTLHAIKAGPNGCRSLLISSPAGFAELIGRAATPAHLAGLDADGCARPRHEPDLRPFLVELPGIEPATKIKLTCRNADSGYAKVREQLLMQLTRQVFTELAEATALWWDVTERRDPDDARRATRQIIAVYRKHQAIITAVNELASYDSVVAENYKAMSDGISERGKAALEHAIAAGGVAPAHLRDGLRADVDA